VRRTFGASEESVGKARRFVSRLVSDLPGELRDEVSLMVSELTTNALVHASSGFDVDVDRSDAALTISVTDRGDGTPAIQSPSSSEPHGRGLRIVEALSDDWGIGSSTEAGKTVWFRMSLPGAPTGRQEGDGIAGAKEGDADPGFNRVSKPASRLTDPDTERVDQPNVRHRAPRRRPHTDLRTPAGHRSLVRITA
jgi:anti-sigma regulatory factor (Ser/Thr protein kinase)